jgi:dTDP-4-amino-4,6-dideoxygalactose transaminase
MPLQGQIGNRYNSKIYRTNPKKYNPYNIVEEFEISVAKYSGSKYGVAVDCCTNALFLSMKLLQHFGLWDTNIVTIPAFTYISVANSIIHAGGRVQFDDLSWKGIYYLKPYNIVDGAKRFRSGMYERETLHCLSFHYKKHVPIGKGGMILTDNKDYSDWLKVARWEGRHNGIPYVKDNVTFCGWNMYMTPDQAARGLSLMQLIRDDNEDLIENYPDLRNYEVFRNV